MMTTNKEQFGIGRERFELLSTLRNIILLLRSTFGIENTET